MFDHGAVPSWCYSENSAGMKYRYIWKGISSNKKGDNLWLYTWIRVHMSE